MPSTLSIITATFTDRGERQRALGFWSGTAGAGLALGPIVGGLLLAHFWWGSVFLINVPVALLGLLCAIRWVPDSKDPAAKRLDSGGSLLSITGLGLVLWAVIEAPVHGWTSALVLGAGAGGLAMLMGFVLWERSCSHPLLELSVFHSPRFSAAVVCNGLLAFGLYGALFVMTQLLQFQLGYTPLQAGLRVLPAAGAIALVAPFSSILVRRLGTKLTVAAGLLLVAGGLWQVSGASVTTTYGEVVLGMVMLGIGAGLVIPSSTGAVMGSVPTAHTGVGSATNGAFMQVGGALGVAVIGSLLSTRYQHRITDKIAPYHIPQAIQHTISGSLGGALGVAKQVGGATGELLAGVAHSAFISGMDLGLLVAAGVALAGVLFALLALPARPTAEEEDPSDPSA
jgi:hypothetical protein